MILCVLALGNVPTRIVARRRFPVALSVSRGKSSGRSVNVWNPSQVRASQIQDPGVSLTVPDTHGLSVWRAIR